MTMIFGLSATGAACVSPSPQPVTANPVRTLTLRGRCGGSRDLGSDAGALSPKIGDEQARKSGFRLHVRLVAVRSTDVSRSPNS
jgi:hypothetical protein